MKNILILANVIIFLVLNSCDIPLNEGRSESRSSAKIDKQKPVSFDEYIQMIKSDSGLIVTENGNHGIAFSLHYQPPTLCALQETGMACSQSVFDETLGEYNQATYFKLDIKQQNAGLFSGADSSKNIFRNNAINHYLGYKIQEDLKIIQGTDTIPCVMSHLVDERTMGRLSVLCVFDRIRNSDFCFYWKDSVVLNDSHHFYFNGEDIRNVNSIKIKF